MDFVSILLGLVLGVLLYALLGPKRKKTQQISKSNDNLDDSISGDDGAALAGGRGGRGGRGGGDGKGGAAGSAANPYLQTALNVIRQLLKAEPGKDPTDDGWEVFNNKDGVSMSRKPIPGLAVPFVRGHCIIKQSGLTPGQVLGVATDLSVKQDVDSLFKQGRIVQVIDQCSKIVHLQYKRQWPTSPRSFCLFQHIRKLDDGGFVAAFRSVQHPDCPVASGFVRAEVKLSGYIIRPVEEGISLTYCALVDLKGSLPGSILRKVANEQPLVARNIARVCAKVDLSKFEETAQKAVPLSDPLDGSAAQMPAGGAGEVAPSAAGAAGASVSFDENSHSSKINEVIPAAGTLELDEATRIRLKTLGNVSIASILQEASAHPLVEDGWKMLSEQHEVKIYRRTLVPQSQGGASSKIHMLLGVGIVPHEASKFFAAISKSDNRRLYDRMLKDIRVLTEPLPIPGEEQKAPLAMAGDQGDAAEMRVAENPSIVYMHHETRQCLFKTARDFVLLQASKTPAETGGKFVLAARSVNLPQVPLVDGLTRANILCAGWTVEPISEHSSRVCYLVQIDLGGIPSSLVNLISKRQPLAIYYVSQWLSSVQ